MSHFEASFQCSFGHADLSSAGGHALPERVKVVGVAPAASINEPFTFASLRIEVIFGLHGLAGPGLNGEVAGSVLLGVLVHPGGHGGAMTGAPIFTQFLGSKVISIATAA